MQGRPRRLRGWAIVRELDGRRFYFRSTLFAESENWTDDLEEARHFLSRHAARHERRMHFPAGTHEVRIVPIFVNP